MQLRFDFDGKNSSYGVIEFEFIFEFYLILKDEVGACNEDNDIHFESVSEPAGLYQITFYDSYIRNS
jgi:hypothetical protein